MEIFGVISDRGLWSSLVKIRASGVRDPGANPGNPIITFL